MGEFSSESGFLFGLKSTGTASIVQISLKTDIGPDFIYVYRGNKARLRAEFFISDQSGSWHILGISFFLSFFRSINKGKKLGPIQVSLRADPSGFDFFYFIFSSFLVIKPINIRGAANEGDS